LATIHADASIIPAHERRDEAKALLPVSDAARAVAGWQGFALSLQTAAPESRQASERRNATDEDELSCLYH
jgi:hypothetical protein